MERKVCLGVALVLIVSLFSPVWAAGVPGPGVDALDLYEVPDVSKMNGQQLVEEIDKEMYMLYGEQTGQKYYRARINAWGNIRYGFLEADLERNEGKYKLPALSSPVIYDPKDRRGMSSEIPNPGDNAIGRIKRNFAGRGDQEIPVWGVDAAGEWYTDWSAKESRWFTVGWSGYRFNGMFWDNSKDREVMSYDAALRVMAKHKPDRRNWFLENSTFYGLKTLPGLPDDALGQLIQDGVDTYWSGVTGAQLDMRSGSQYVARRGGVIHNNGEYPPPPKGVTYKNPSSAWLDKIFIVIPPTYISWGYGVRFSPDPGNANIIYEVNIPIAPINMMLDDLSVAFDTPVTQAAPGQTVTLKVKTVSTFAKETQPDYRWHITGVSGATFSDGGVTGHMAVPPMTMSGMGIVERTVSFVMPPNDVNVSFEINPGRKVEENGNYDNNIAVHTITNNNKGVAGHTDNIPPWVLTKAVTFDLSSSATLTLPQGSWNGNATGSLTVNNGSTNIYNNFVVSNNPAVNVASSFITREPNIKAKLDRADFGDNPKNGSFGRNNVSLTKNGLVSGSGSVSRPYRYTTSSTDVDGKTRTTTHNGTATANFSEIDDKRAFTFDVYNGLKVLPFKKTFVNLAKQGKAQNSGIAYDFSWKGTPLPFDVVRWMCHRDTNDNESGWEAVGGQYERTFVGQSTGSLTWKALTSQAQGYAADRANAAAGKKGSANYEHAVFATDKPLQSIAYPIKSGYYFDPLGTYTCTVKTAQYKDSTANTQEHEDLVAQVKASFRYDSTLHYINKDRNTTKLEKISQDNPRTLLTITAAATGKKTTKLATTRARTGTVDNLLSEVMEGYAGSMTGDSWDEFRYRERTDKAIYLVEEETVITFKLAPQAGIKLYTDVGMPNGDYVIKVWQEPFSLDMADADTARVDDKLDFTKDKPTVFDGLKVTVRGSMYDDT